MYTSSVRQAVLKCISKWIRGYAVTTRNNQRLRSVGGNERRAKCCALCKFHVTVGQNCTRVIRVIEGPNVHDQIAFCAFHPSLVEVQMKAGLHTCNACVITTWPEFLESRLALIED